MLLQKGKGVFEGPNVQVREHTFLLGLIAISLLALVIRIYPGPSPIDDAFITFRYVDNIADGFGFTYNPGDRLLGTSTPLYTLLLVVIRRLGIQDLPLVTLLLNSTADAVTSILLALMALRLTGLRKAALSVGLIWALCVPSITFARSGMETSLFVLTIAASFYSLLMTASYRSSIFASIAALVRPDGLLVLFLAASATLYFQRRKLPAFAFISATIILPWVVFGTLYFGNPIPHSAIVKSSGTILPELVLKKLFVDLPVTFFLGGAMRQLFGPLAVAITGAIVFLSALSFLYLFIRSFHQERVWLFIGAYPVLYVLALLVRQIYAFPWYLIPPLAVIFLGVICGAYNYRQKPGLILTALLLSVNLGALFVQGNFWMLDRQMQQRLQDYNEASAIIEQWSIYKDSEPTVAVTEVGIIGYRLRPVSMLDMAGLVSDNRNSWAKGITPVEQHSPEFIVGITSQLDSYRQRYPTLGPFLDRHYVLAWQQYNSLNEEIVIYCRNDLQKECKAP